MTAQKGVEFLLKVDIASTFTTVAGCRTLSFSRSRNPVDVTNADSSGLARELLSTAGTKQASISFSGVFTDAASDAALETDFEAGTLRDFQIVVPDYGTYEGGFVITQLDFSGSYDAHQEFSMTLESGDAWTFT